MWDRIVIISLERRPERLARVQAEIARDWPWKPPIVQKAIDGHRCKCPGSGMTDMEDPMRFRQGDYAWGCLRSHHRALEDAINDGCESLLVLEDDAILTDRFSERAERFMTALPNDWEIVFLGGVHHLMPSPVNDFVSKALDVECMHCYGMRGTGLRALYDYWSHWTAVHCDWAIRSWVATRNVYSPPIESLQNQRGWLAEQGDNFSDIAWRVKTAPGVIDRIDATSPKPGMVECGP